MKKNRISREWLKQIRNDKGMTQNEVAEKAGVSRATYTKYENGTREPHPITAQKIAFVLGFNWTRFYQ